MVIIIIMIIIMFEQYHHDDDHQAYREGPFEKSPQLCLFFDQQNLLGAPGSHEGSAGVQTAEHTHGGEAPWVSGLLLRVVGGLGGPHGGTRGRSGQLQHQSNSSKNASVSLCLPCAVISQGVLERAPWEGRYNASLGVPGLTPAAVARMRPPEGPRPSSGFPVAETPSGWGPPSWAPQGGAPGQGAQMGAPGSRLTSGSMTLKRPAASLHLSM